MGRRADNSVYVTEATLLKVERLARLLSRDQGRRVTFGEAVERAMDIALSERAREGVAVQP